MEPDKSYEPRKFEDEIYQNWENKGLFNPDTLNRKGQEHFSMVLPPPNVTGVLHLGHAAMLAIEDLFARYKRMRGLDTVWIPGTDHASIATQNVVEKKLLKNENKTRHDLSRAEFLEKVAEHVEESKNVIHAQVRKMGTSLDWSREAYTLDDVRSRAVRKVFKMMYDDGLIYRGYRIVNWCPRCQSTLADDEIEYAEQKAKVYTFKYDKNFPIAIATTRPETKVGDTAVAVNPEDERYAKYIGQEFAVDFCGVPLKIKIIADAQVEKEFGTGALGVTPAHSAVDYEMALKNNLPVIKVIDENGAMTDKAGPFAGLKAAAAREAIVKELERCGLLEKVEEIDNKLSVCYRCGTAVEPLTSDQWFVNVNKPFTLKSKIAKIVGKKQATLKQVSLAVVEQSKIKIIPDKFEKVYLHWMANLHDWCISRQLWFGHRIPVWYCADCGATMVSDRPETELVFARHGEAAGNAEGILNSDIERQENGLTEQGRSQAQTLAEKLKNEKFAAIIASDFKRTRETAEILAQTLNLPIATDARLREVGVGEWEGKSEKDFTAFRQADFSAWHHASPRGIESFDSLRGRVFEFLQEITKKYAGQKVLLVAHGDVIRLAQGFRKKMNDEDIFQLGYPRVGEFLRLQYAPEACQCGSFNLRQDEDTLDTWFSSGLWSFTTLLPPDWDGENFDSEDFKRFHPLSVMETGYDILFFWVARMILMTTYAVGDVPFENVYLHGLIRDKDGDKMSKSKPETAIDPLVAGEKYGFDAVRLSLLIGSTAGNDVRLYDEKIEGFRNFVNKLWNISRFVLLSIDPRAAGKIKPRTLADSWILSRFNFVKKEFSALLDDFQYSAAGELLRDFVWNDFADWYLEIAKVEKNKDAILRHILHDSLKLWHPFIPYVTQAIWNNLLTDEELMVAAWPAVEKKFIDEKTEKQFAELREIIVKIRNMRSEYKVEPAKKIIALFKGKTKVVEENAEVIKTLARLEQVDFVKVKPEQAAMAVADKLEIYLPLAGLLDLEKEISRLKKERENLTNYLAATERKLANEEFVKNAPPAVVAGDRARLAEAQEKLAQIESRLKELK